MQKEYEIVERVQQTGCDFRARDLFRRYCKKIDAYLKRSNQSLDKEDYYFKKYTEDEFDKLVKQYYAVKGDVTPQSILKAKLKSEQKETEHDIQVKVVKYLTKLKIKHFAVPNGFIRGGQDRVENARYMNYMKSEGFKNGVFDLVLLPGCGRVAFLELKTEQGRPSEHQKEWKEFFDQNNYPSTIAYGYEEAERFINSLIDKQ